MDNWFNRSSWVRLVTGAACVVAALGCGGSQPVESPVKGMSEDQQSIVDLVHGLADYAAQDLKSLRSKFTKDAAPKSSDQAKMKKAYFDIDGDINVSGETANFQVKVSGGPPVAWKAVSQDGFWLLSETPMN